MSTTYKSPRKKLPSGVKTTSEIILDITSGLSRTLLNIDSLYKGIVLFSLVFFISLYGDFMQPESIGYFSEVCYFFFISLKIYIYI